MVTITATEGSRYLVEYRLQGTLVQRLVYNASDIAVALAQVKTYMMQDLAHLHGKVYAPKEGNH